MAERIVKIMLSVLVTALFVAIGVAVAQVRPFDLVGDLARVREASAGAPGPAQDDTPAPPLPVPPDTDLTLRTSSAEGRLYRYESRLSQQGLWVFYTQEMPRRGWRRDEGFDRAAMGRSPEQAVLSFKAGPTRCIIGLEDSGPFTTAVTVLIVGAETG